MILKPGNPLEHKPIRTKQRGPRTRARARCDKLFSLYIRKRDGECRSCEGTDRLQCAHIVPRRYLSVRWTPENAVALCLRCHSRFTASPAAWAVWVDETFGEGYYLKMHRQALERWDGDYGVVEESLKALS